MDKSLAQQVLGQGFEMQKAGRLKEAAANYQQVLKAYPKQPDALHLLGTVTWQLGNAAKGRSLIKKAISQQPKSPHFLVSLGQLEAESGQFPAAIKAIQRAIALQPDFIEANYLLAELFYKSGDVGGCVTALRRVVELAPNHLMARFQLSQMPSNLVPMDEGLAHITHATTLQPDSSVLLAEKAVLLEMANRLEEAGQAAQAALAADPNEPTAQYITGQLAFRSGNLDEAEACLTGLEGERALFTLGLVLDRKGAYSRAFQAFSAAHADAQTTPVWQSVDIDAYPSMVGRLAAWMETKPSHNTTLPDDGLDSPIFIVGFVRSGTTLSEQALASLPSLTGSGEKLSMDAFVLDIPEVLGRKETYPKLLETLTLDDISKLRTHYWRKAEEALGPIEGRLIDKQPMNMVHLPLIKCLFPDAKVIFMERDPKDIVLSCYMQRFVPNVLTCQFHDLDKTAKLFGQVMALWSLYTETYDVMTTSYEALTEDFEGNVRKLVTYIGEPWDDAVLNYAQTAKKSAVDTASYRDVTSPIFKRSVRRWENYRDEMASVLSSL